MIKFSKKLNYCSENIWRKIFLFKKNFVFKTSEKSIYSRSSIIPLIFSGLFVKIYTGKKWRGRQINKWMVGHKFGEFTWNRKMATYKAKQKKKKKNNEIWTIITNLLIKKFFIRRKN